MPFKITLSNATPADSRRIADLHIANWRETYRGALTDRYLDVEIWEDRRQDWIERLNHPADNQHVLIAEDQGQLVGFVCIYGDQHPRFGTLIENLHADKSHRGKGVGKQLFFKAAEWSQQTHPNASLYLEVIESNTAAISFYQALGGIHVESNIWTPPGGGKLVEHSYAWENVAELLEQNNYSRED